MKLVYCKLWKSPVCDLYLYADDEHLLAVTFKENNSAVVNKLKLNEAIKQTSPIIEKAIQQLNEYFQGQRKKFELPVTLQGTDFQMRAWKELRRIPFGKTISYSEQAVKMESPKAVRAVGSANGKNPISIIIPCHRVITCQSKISGYAGGAEVKGKLLELERS